MIRLSTILLILFTNSIGYAQKRSPANTTTPTSQQPSSVDPSVLQPKIYEPKKKKTTGYKTTYDARERFYVRMEEVAKAHRKAEKEMQKAQYANPSYFGHKKPPVKNPPGKMKYCKECGMRH
jgi:hypothetical protein